MTHADSSITDIVADAKTEKQRRRKSSKKPTTTIDGEKAVQSSMTQPTRKPLNFAPPSMYTSKDTLQTARKKPPKAIDESMLDAKLTTREPNAIGFAANPRSRPKRSRKPRAGAPMQQMSAQPGSESTTRVRPSDSLASSQMQEPRVVPLFAAVHDPFPNERDDIAGLEHEHEPDTRVAVVKDKEKNNKTGDQPKLLDTQPNKARPTKSQGHGRNNRARKAQMPVAMYTDGLVTRGPHGRLVFATTSKHKDVVSTGRDIPSDSPRSSTSQSTTDVQADRRRIDHAEIARRQRQESLVFAPPSQQQSISEHAQEGTPDRNDSRAPGKSDKTKRKPYFQDHVSREEALAGLKVLAAPKPSTFLGHALIHSRKVNISKVL